MDRYQFTPIVQDSGSLKQMYGATYYPVIEATSNDIYLNPHIGMRLDNLAYEYYGDAGLWWVIAIANNIGKGTLTITEQMQLRIPDPAQIETTLSEKLQAAQTKEI